MIKQFFQKELPVHLLYVAIGLALSFVLFFMPIINGKTILQADIISTKSIAKEVSDFEEKTGEESMWTNSLFGGMPTYMIKRDIDGNIFQYIVLVLRMQLPYETVGIMFTYFLFLYLFFAVMKIPPAQAFFGSMMFALSSYNIIIIEAGHITKAYAIGYIPLILTGMLLTLKRKYLLGSIITCIGLGVQVYTNHVQITYYTGMLTVVMFLSWFVYAVKNKEIVQWLKSTAFTLVAVVMALLPNYGGLMSSFEYSKETMRGGSELSAEKVEKKKNKGLEKDYAFAWSQGKVETFSLLIPHFMGGGSQENIGKDSESYKVLLEKAGKETAESFAKSAPTYWGDQPGTSGAIYFGSIIVFLALLGFFVIEGPLKWWLIFGAALSMALSWGKNFELLNYFFFDYLPFYNMFRSVSMWLAITSLVFVVSAVFAMYQWISNVEKNKEKYLKYLYLSYSVTGGLCLFFALFGASLFDFVSPNDEIYIQKGYPDWLIDAIRIDRESMMTSDAFNSFLFISAAFAGLFLVYKKFLKAEYVVLSICVLSLIDIYKVDKAFFDADKFEKVKKKFNIEPNSADLQILQDKDPNYRVLNLAEDTYNDSRTSYFHKSVGGYHPAKLGRYQSLIENHLSKQNMSVINMLNTRYFIVNNNGQLGVYKNEKALGNAWFVDTLKVVNSARNEIDALNPPFNPKTTAIIDSSFFVLLKEKKTNLNSQGKIILKSYQPNKLVYVSVSSTGGFAVFSEIYFKDGWTVSIDGKEADHVRVNYVLRGMEIPLGQHEITFVFYPEGYYKGQLISGVSSLMLLMIIVLSIGWSIYKSKKHVGSNTKIDQ